MSVSLREVINAGGYDLTTVEDAEWLVSKKSEFEQLVDEAEALIETENNKEDSYDPQPEGDFSGSSEDPEFGGR